MRFRDFDVAGSDLRPDYLSGFGNEHARRPCPARCRSAATRRSARRSACTPSSCRGTAFTEPRARNRRTWLYRIRPSAAHPPFARADDGGLRAAPFHESVPDPNRLRWDPLPLPAAPTDFVDGLWTLGGNGDVAAQPASASTSIAPTGRWPTGCFSDADGELLIVPQRGRAAARHGAGAARGAAGQHRAGPSRGAFPRRAARRARRAGTSARTTARRSTCPSSARSAPTGWRTRGTSARPSRPTRTSSGRREVVQQVRRQPLARRRRPLAARRRRVARQPMCRTSTTCARFNAMGTRQLRPPGPVDLHGAHVTVRHRRAWPTCDFVVFPPRWLVGEDTFRPP